MKIKLKSSKSAKSINHKKTTSTESFFATHIKQIGHSFVALWQRPIGNLLTLAVIAIALTTPACMYLLSKNIGFVASELTRPSQINVYFQDNTPESRIMVLKDQWENKEEISSVKYISSQDGLDELSQLAGFEQAISLLDGYALPSVLLIMPENIRQENLKALAEMLQNEQDVADVRLNEDWLERLDAIRALMNMMAICLSVLMVVAAFLIVGNTLRFNVQANRDEIQTMKLIGATDHYILRPYLYSGIWFGVLGATIAWLLTMGISLLLKGPVEYLAVLYNSSFRLMLFNWDESLLLLMLGFFLGGIAARFSANRHLREIEPI